MARRIREEYIDDDVAPVEVVPVTRRRIVTERRVDGAPYGVGMNPMAMVMAAVLVVFILVLVFGYLL